MATITISVQTSQGTVSTSRTISASDLTRVIDVYRGILNMPTNTDAEVLAAWEVSMLQGIRATVLSILKMNAATSAEAGVPDIVIS